MMRYLLGMILLLGASQPAFAQTTPPDEPPPPENTTVPGTGPLPVQTRWIESPIQVPIESTSLAVDLGPFFDTFDYPGPILTLRFEVGPEGDGATVEEVPIQLYYADPFPEDHQIAEYELADDDDDPSTPPPTLSSGIDFMAQGAVRSLLDDVAGGRLDETILHAVIKNEFYEGLFGGLWQRSNDEYLDLEQSYIGGETGAIEDSYLPRKNDLLYLVPPGQNQVPLGSFVINFKDMETQFPGALIAGRILGDETPSILNEVFNWTSLAIPGFSNYGVEIFEIPLLNYTQEDLNSYKPVKWENYARITGATISNQTDAGQMTFELVTEPSASGITASITEAGLLTVTLDHGMPGDGPSKDLAGSINTLNQLVTFQVNVNYAEGEITKTRLLRRSILFDFYADLALLNAEPTTFNRGASQSATNPGNWTTALFGSVYSHYVEPEAPEDDPDDDGTGEEEEVEPPLDPASDGVWQAGEWFWSHRHGYIYPAVTEQELRARTDVNEDGIPDGWTLHETGFWFYDRVPGEEEGFGWVWTSVSYWPTFYSHRFGEWLAYIGGGLEAVPENGQTTYLDERKFWSWTYKHPDGPFWGGYVTPELVDDPETEAVDPILSLVEWVDPEPPEDGDTGEGGE